MREPERKGNYCFVPHKKYNKKYKMKMRSRVIMETDMKSGEIRFEQFRSVDCQGNYHTQLERFEAAQE